MTVLLLSYLSAAPLALCSDAHEELSQSALHFPHDRAVGTLLLNQNGLAGNRLDAKGNVRVPDHVTCSLELMHAGSIDLSFLPKIGSRQLTAIDMKGFPVEDSQFGFLLALPWLQFLSANNTNLGNVGMRVIGKLKSLTHLRISRTLVTDQGFYHIKGLTNLEKLDASNLKLNNQCIAQLSSLSKLQSLTLGATGIDDQAMPKLAKLPKLSLLHIGHNHITDSGISKLLPLTRLEELNITDTNVTQAVVPTLRKFPKLRLLTISFSDMTAEDLAAFKKGLPHCRLTNGHTTPLPLSIFAPLK